MSQETETKRGPVWNENNELVDPDLNQHFREQAEIVLGKRAPLETEAEDSASDEEKSLRAPANVNTPYVSQQMDSQTADPLTSPQPDSDPNNVPTKLTPMTAETVELDRKLRTAAEAITDEQIKREPEGDTHADPPAKKLLDEKGDVKDDAPQADDFAKPNATVSKLVKPSGAPDKPSA